MRLFLSSTVGIYSLLFLKKITCLQVFCSSLNNTKKICKLQLSKQVSCKADKVSDHELDPKAKKIPATVLLCSDEVGRLKLAENSASLNFLLSLFPLQIYVTLRGGTYVVLNKVEFWASEDPSDMHQHLYSPTPDSTWLLGSPKSTLHEVHTAQRGAA